MSKKSRQPSSEPYLTVVQAAEHLLVHPSTIRRWTDRGRLPVYRLGEKRIGVRPSNLARLVAPRPPRPGQRGDMAHAEQPVVPHLTKAEQRRGLQALAEPERFRDELAAKHGKLTPESWELLNQSRDERTRDLMRAVAESIIAPPLLSREVANVIRQRMRQGELDRAGARAVLARFLAIPIALQALETLYDRTLVLADDCNLPAVYGAYYVALAEQLGATFWTADQRLLRARGGRLPLVRWIGDYGT